MSKAIHPEIGSLIFKRDRIWNLLYEDYQPIKALAHMTGLLYELQRAHRDDTLVENINKQRLHFRQTKSRTLKNQYSENMRPVFEDYLEEINNLLWKHEYLLEGTYRPKTRKDTLFE